MSLYSLAKNKPWALILLSGIMLAAAFPPSPLGPLVYLAFVPLFFLLENLPADASRPRRKTRLGRFFRSNYFRGVRYTYLTFLIWNVLCCYWLTLTMVGAGDFAEGVEYFGGGFMAIVVNPLLMSLPWLVYMHARRVLPPLLSALCLVFLWLTFEYLHFRWDLSWSWLTIGHSMTMINPMIQYAEFTGITGVGLHIMLGNVLIYSLLRSRVIDKKWNMRKLALAAFWIALPLMLYPLIMHKGRAVFQPSGHMAVRVVQPSIDPFIKFEELSRADQYRRFVELSVAEGADTIDMVLLPETALPYPGGIDMGILLSDSLNRKLWAAVDSFGYSILTGLIEREVFTDPETAPPSATEWHGRFYDSYNAAVMMRPDRAITFYEKIKLVPFVERMPFLGFLGKLRKQGIDLTMGFSGYGMPDSLKTLYTHNGVPVGTLICYESEFVGVAREHVNRGAQMMVVITNDGWWGQSSGYVQHAYLSRLRAIETRRDIARSANTGRSLFVDARGHITKATGWYDITHIDQRVQLHTARTFFVRYGDYLGTLSFSISIIILLATILLRLRRSKSSPANN